MTKSVIKDVLGFIKKPKLEESKQTGFWHVLYFIMKGLSFVGVFYILFFIVIGVIDLPENQIQDSIREHVILGLFLAIAAAPLLEETIFRSFLRPTKRSLSFGIPFVILFIYNIFIVDFIPTDFIESLNDAEALLFVFGPYLIALFASFLLFSNFKNRPPKAIESSISKNIRWYFYATSLIFAVVHLGNYGLEYWYLLPVLVFPQLVVGLYLGYVRIRYGFWWAVFVHAMNNGIAILISIPAFVVSEERLELLNNNSGEFFDTVSVGEALAVGIMLISLLLTIVSIITFNVINLVDLGKSRLDKSSKRI